MTSFPMAAAVSRERGDLMEFVVCGIVSEQDEFGFRLAHLSAWEGGSSHC